MEMSNEEKIKRRRARASLKAAYLFCVQTANALRNDCYAQLLSTYGDKKVLVGRVKRNTKLAADKKDHKIAVLDESFAIKRDVINQANSIVMAKAKADIRALHLARAFVFGQSYRTLERTTKRPPQVQLIACHIKVWAPEFFNETIVDDIIAWMEQA